MALDIKPTLQTLVVNYVVTLGVFGGILYASIGKPGEYYYQTPYNDHAPSGGYEALSCAACHPKAFQEVTNADCTNSKCHQDYQPTATQWERREVYDKPDWVSVASTNPHILKKERAHLADVALHNMPWIKGMSCMECHKTHTKPPVPVKFDHRADGVFFPESGDLTRCLQCHTYNQAPPIIAHVSVLREKTTDCFACHQSSNAWTEQVQWVGRPSGLSDEEGRRPISAGLSAATTVPAAGSSTAP